MTPTKCEDCGKIAGLYQVEIPQRPKGEIVIITINPRRWICLECWQNAASSAESLKLNDLLRA